MIELTLAAELTITVADAIEVGATPAGFRRVIPITGGEARGPRLHGRILPGGADVQLIRPDGVAELVARYVLETPDGARVFIENRGLRHGPPDAMERLRRGEPVDPALIYFRTAPRFETGNGPYAWLMRHTFVGNGVRRPDRVELSVYQVL
jgi:hypothetical protein